MSYGSSNEYGDVGFSSGSSSETNRQPPAYGNGPSHFDRYDPASSGPDSHQPGIPTNVKFGIGITALGIAAMMYRPGTGAKLVKEASKKATGPSSKVSSTKSSSFTSVAEQMQEKFKSTADSVKSS